MPVSLRKSASATNCETNAFNRRRPAYPWPFPRHLLLFDFFLQRFLAMFSLSFSSSFSSCVSGRVVVVVVAVSWVVRRGRYRSGNGCRLLHNDA